MENEMKIKNFKLFLNKLEGIGIDISQFETKLGDKLMNAPFAPNNDMNLAYEGSLIQTVLRIFTPYAVKLNGLLPEELRVSTESIVKVCLLIHLSKCESLIPNDNQWERDNRGIMFKYAPSTVALKSGIKSVILAQSLGVQFTAEEIEAMTIIDRESDAQAKFYSSTLATIVKEAHDLAMLQCRLTK
jgi:hypothetical protein